VGGHQAQEGAERLLPRPLLATFIVDRSGVAVRHLVGVDNMAWSTDFPHHGNDWPYSRRVIDTLFAEVPEEERRKIVCTNAARFWSLAT
jgi:predicted TIM-barrel fold metal-dependent hydrolase